MTKLRKICAWCNRIADGRGPVHPDQSVTHTICLACSLKELARSKPRTPGPACQRRIACR